MGQLLELSMEWKKSKKRILRLAGCLLIRIPVIYSKLAEKKIQNEEVPFGTEQDQEWLFKRILSELELQHYNE